MVLDALFPVIPLESIAWLLSIYIEVGGNAVHQERQILEPAKTNPVTPLPEISLSSKFWLCGRLLTPPSRYNTESYGGGGGGGIKPRGLPHVMENGFFSRSGKCQNFEICQGKIEFWKMSGKTDLSQGKIQFPGVHAKNLPILGHQVPIFSFFPIQIYMLL